MSQKANKSNRQPNNNNSNPVSNMDDCYSNSIVDSTYTKAKNQSNKNNKNNSKNNPTDCR